MVDLITIGAEDDQWLDIASDDNIVSSPEERKTSYLRDESLIHPTDVDDFNKTIDDFMKKILKLDIKEIELKQRMDRFIANSAERKPDPRFTNKFVLLETWCKTHATMRDKLTAIQAQIYDSQSNFILECYKSDLQQNSQDKAGLNTWIFFQLKSIVGNLEENENDKYKKEDYVEYLNKRRVDIATIRRENLAPRKRHLATPVNEPPLPDHPPRKRASLNPPFNPLSLVPSPIIPRNSSNSKVKRDSKVGENQEIRESEEKAENEKNDNTDNITTGINDEINNNKNIKKSRKSAKSTLSNENKPSTQSIILSDPIYTHTPPQTPKKSFNKSKKTEQNKNKNKNEQNENKAKNLAPTSRIVLDTNLEPRRGKDLRGEAPSFITANNFLNSTQGRDSPPPPRSSPPPLYYQQPPLQHQTVENVAWSETETQYHQRLFFESHYPRNNYNYNGTGSGHPPFQY